MAVAFTPLAGIISYTTNVESYAGTAGTPAANDLLICLVNVTATSATGGTMTGTWTWNQLTSLAYNSALDALYVFWAYASAATSTTPTFVTLAGDPAASCEIYCLRVTGSSGVMCPCIRQIGGAIGAGANPAIIMPGAINTNNGCISWVAENGTAAGSVFTNPTNWTTDIESGTGTSPRHAAAESHGVSGETGSTITWTAAAKPWGAIVMEFCLLGGRQMSPSGGAYSSPMAY